MSHPVGTNNSRGEEYEKDEELGSTSGDEPTANEEEEYEFLTEVPTEGIHHSRLTKIKTGRENYLLGPRAENVLSTVRSRRPVPAFSHPLGQSKTKADVIVTFQGKDDPYHPLNWLDRKKLITTLLYSITTMASTWGSSSYSPAVTPISKEFHISTEVSVLGTTLLLFGYGVGALIWAPISEVYGRKPAVLYPFFLCGIFSFGVAVAKDVQTIMICRFFSGFFGAAPVTNTGGVLGDIYPAEKRGIAMVIYSMSVSCGPLIAPVASSAIADSYLGWRWTQYITGILQLFVFAIDVVWLDESYPPALLVAKAKQLRLDTGNWALHAKHEEWDVTLKEMGQKYLIRPFQLLGTPICLLMVIYASFVYALLYACLAVFPLEFQEIRRWNPLQASLPFLSVMVGCVCASGVNIASNRLFVKKLKANNYRPVPEARLYPMMVGGFVFTSGLFIFAWTSDRDISAAGTIVAAAMIGFGFLSIFLAALNYLVDTFQIYAASAIAANTFMRSALAGAFPLFITPMMHNIGLGWGMSVWGFIASLMIPVPFLFYIFGKRLRARGKWSKDSI